MNEWLLTTLLVLHPQSRHHTAFRPYPVPYKKELVYPVVLLYPK